MSWKLRVLVPVLLLAPQAAMALGLGDIRLNSGLNEPLSAEIDLVAATPEEIGALQAKLATREMFQRYGLERPQYLDTLQFRVGKSSDGRSVLTVRSQVPITEPAVTFLVEANWSSGRLLREYTLLLDPPVAGPTRAQSAVDLAKTVAAPQVAPSAPAPAPAVEAPPAAAEAAVAAAGQPGTINVQRNDTLYGIASRLAQGPRATNQMVIALYRANPQAFGGNINRLKAGAELRVPESGAVAGVSSAEAAREIAEQTAAWRTSRDASARLRLVPPREGEGAAPVAPDGASAEEVRRLQQELGEAKRLIELKNQQLAELQARAAAKPPEAAAPPVEAPVAPQDDVGAKPVPEAAPEPEAAPAEPPKVAKPPKRARPAAAAEPGLLDSLAGNWTWLLGALAAVLGGLVAFGYIRRRREEQEGESMAAFTPPPEPSPVADDATRLRAYQPASRDGLIVEEPRLPARGPATAPTGAASRLEDTMSAEAAVNLDQTDPLAEADFHMAYGLYDQAADLMRLALEREPDRRDFKLKLLEIFFVWGNKQRFVETARELHNTKAQGAAGEWDRVAIMGRQIAPGESMFVGAPTAGAASGDVIDLNLGSGDNPVDIDVYAPAGGDAVDLDLGDALGGADSSADTGRNQALDFDLDLSETTANGETATIEMPGPQGEGHTITLDVIGPNAPTVEQPRLRGAALPTDATGVLSSDDLGLDLAALEALVDAPDAVDFGGASTTLVASAAAAEPTRIQPQPRQDTAITAELPAIDATSSMEAFDLDMGDATVEATQRIRNEATGIIDMTGARPLDLDVGGMIDRTEQTATHRLSLHDLASSDLEPVTMSEVGTKLDLARAYVDMGDPEGARSILQEVLTEGSAGQKLEAQRLLDSLPGNA